MPDLLGCQKRCSACHTGFHIYSSMEETDFSCDTFGSCCKEKTTCRNLFFFNWAVQSFFFFFICLFIYLFMAVLGLRFCARAFSSCASGGHSSSRCAGLSLSRPLLLRSTSSRRAGSVVVAHGPSCSAACGIFPDQGSNPCPLHWQADSQPLRHQGSPHFLYIGKFFLTTFYLTGTNNKHESHLGAMLR